MSSHHIVRDEQEPALIIHRWEDFPSEKLGAILEWSPTIICCGPAIEKVLKLGIKIDVAIIAFESRDQYQELLSDQAPLKILSLSQPDYLSSGLQILRQDGHHAVNVITSEALTPEVIDLCEDFSSHLQVSIWDETSRHTIVTHTPFIKWFPKGISLEFYPLNEKAILVIKTDGNEDIGELAFVMQADGKITVNCDPAHFVMVEQHTVQN